MEAAVFPHNRQKKVEGTKKITKEWRNRRRKNIKSNTTRAKNTKKGDFEEEVERKYVQWKKKKKKKKKKEKVSEGKAAGCLAS